ncbi:hypothetical protein [Paenibacillus tundrae]
MFEVIRVCLETPKEAGFDEFSFQARESDAAGGEKAVKDALQRVLRHALVIGLGRNAYQL